MRSLVASDSGVHGPVARRLIESSDRRIVDLDAVKDVDERLGGGNVADIEDHEGTEDAFLQQVHPWLAPFDLDQKPENGEEEDACNRLQCIYERTGDGALQEGF